MTEQITVDLSNITTTEWLPNDSSSVHLTPPHSPAKQQLDNDQLLLMIASDASAASSINTKRRRRYSPSPACCKRHEAQTHGQDHASEYSIIDPDCIGSYTVNRHEQIVDWSIGMTSREYEIRLQIAQIQRLYRRHCKVMRRREDHHRMMQLSCCNNTGRQHSSQSESNNNNQPQQQHFDDENLSVITTNQQHEATETQMTPNPVCIDIAAAAAVDQHRHAIVCIDADQLSEHNDHQYDGDDAQLSSDVSVINDEDRVTLVAADLVDGLRVMIVDGHLLYAGTLHIVDAGLFHMSIDGQRTTRPVILCEDELLNSAVSFDADPSILTCIFQLREIRVNQDCGNVQIGQRVCAIWSQQQNSLYPGTFKADERDQSGRRLALIEFDDGDSAHICYDQIRLLPHDFPITKPDAACILPNFITRQRSSTIICNDRESSTRRRRRRTTDLIVKSQQRCNDASGRWQWMGDAISNSRRLTVYRSVHYGSVQINTGDLVHMLEPTTDTAANTHRYVAIVQRFWQTRNGIQKMRVAWCYRADEIVAPKRGRHQLLDDVSIARHALFRSQHCDDNSIQSLSERCHLLSWSQFKQQYCRDGQHWQAADANTYFIAGDYDPVRRIVTYTM